MKETFYFSHDYNARRDSKLVSLVMHLGSEGYGIWWQCVEMIYEKSDPYITIDDLPIIAYETRVDISKIEKFFDICKKVGLFVEGDDGFYNQRILDNLERRDEIRNKRAEAGSRGGRMKQAKDKGTHSKNDWEEMKNYFGECVRCGCKDQIEKDHIVAVYNGGSDGIDNLQPLCKRCNTAKGPDETDYRIIYCEAKYKQMLDKWVSNEYQIVAKERKGKEIKEKESKTEIVATQPNEYQISISYLKNIENEQIPDYAEKYQDEWIKFCYYWSEKGKTGKIRAEGEKTFEIKRRFATWIGRKVETYQKQSKVAKVY